MQVNTVETWAIIPGYPAYEASSLGRVRSIPRKDAMNRSRKPTVLKQFYDSRKLYLCVNLWRDGKHKMMRVHRIIAMAHLPNPSNLPEVNHKDECKTNNCVSNLEWCDHRYNNVYGSKAGKWVGEKNIAAKFNRETALFIWKNHKCNGGDLGTTELSRKTGVSIAHVSAIAHGNRRREELNDVCSRHTR